MNGYPNKTQYNLLRMIPNPVALMACKPIYANAESRTYQLRNQRKAGRGQ